MVVIFSLSVQRPNRFWLSQSVWIYILFVRVIFAYFPHFLWWTRQKFLFYGFSVKINISILCACYVVHQYCTLSTSPVHSSPHIPNLRSGSTLSAVHMNVCNFAFFVSSLHTSPFCFLHTITVLFPLYTLYDQLCFRRLHVTIIIAEPRYCNTWLLPVAL